MVETLDIFNKFQTILCMCPNCSSLLRLSELHLRSKTPSPRTWLDEYNVQKGKVAELDDKVSEKESAQEAILSKKRDQATQRGRKKVVKTVLESLDVTSIEKLKQYNPFDVKPIIHPVDFVIFNGDYEAKKSNYRDKEIQDVVFLSKKSENSDLLNLQESVNQCVKEKNYDFKLVRISDTGKITFE